MKREIYEVYAKVIDANGTYNTLTGYPKVFDSHQNNDDVEKAKSKAYGEYHTVLGTMYTRTDRQGQFAMIIRASDGLQIEKTCIGTVADLPDPTYAVTVNNGTGSGNYIAHGITKSISYSIHVNFRLIKSIRLSQGGISEVSVDIRILLKETILNNATVIAFCHNHPSGNIRPSAVDDRLTQSLQKACDVMRIHFLDHVIVCDGQYYSYHENGKL